MKKILPLLLAAFFCSLLPAKEPAPKGKAETFSVKAEAASPVVKADTAVTVKLKAVFPETHEFAQRSFFAYLPALPEEFIAFGKKAGLKFNTKGNPKWHSVTMDSRWLPAEDRGKQEHTAALSVKGWPAGDYQISISCYFQPRKKDPALKGVYRQASFTFTIE